MQPSSPMLPHALLRHYPPLQLALQEHLTTLAVRNYATHSDQHHCLITDKQEMQRAQETTFMVQQPSHGRQNKGWACQALLTIQSAGMKEEGVETGARGAAGRGGRQRGGGVGDAVQSVSAVCNSRSRLHWRCSLLRTYGVQYVVCQASCHSCRHAPENMHSQCSRLPLMK